MCETINSNTEEQESNEKPPVTTYQSLEPDLPLPSDHNAHTSDPQEPFLYNHENNEMSEGKEEGTREPKEPFPYTEESNDSSEEKEEGMKGAKEHFEALQKEISQITEPDQKLQKVIDFMELTLAQKGTPHFKSFWEARNLCIELFKLNIAPAVKQPLWNKYSDLSKEARRLREILDEQSAFAAEQIEIAIHALENEIVNIPPSGETSSNATFLASKTLEPKLPFYFDCQQQLIALNAQAARITALRKELIRTNMRIRTKNKFFQRLSLAGDLVFPKRKDLIKEVSQTFIDDVEDFIKQNFSTDSSGESLFFLREEIKALQSIAKVLTLNTHAFTHTRLRLSECWDKVKSEEKDRKKVRVQQKAVFKQNYEEIHNMIQLALNSFNSNELTLPAVKGKIDEIVLRMRQIELGHDELKALRQEIADLRKTVDEKIQAAEQHRSNQEEEKERQRRKAYEDIFTEIGAMFTHSNETEIDSLISQKADLLDKILNANLTKKEKQELEKKLKPIQDIISDKKEKAVLSLSDDDRHALKQLKDLLKEKKERRQEIKNHMELLRKSKGSSGMDFEQALQSSSQLEIERTQLEKVNASIQEIEDKIEELGFR